MDASGWQEIRCHKRFSQIVQFQKIFNTPPTEGIGISWGKGGSVGPKNLKKCMKLHWDFQRGGGRVLEKIPSVGEVYGYFLELHILISAQKLLEHRVCSLSRNKK